MSAAPILTPHDPAFDRFLYASVGEDRRGARVSVLSALARFFDVPALIRDHASVAQSLSGLLPDRVPRGAVPQPDAVAGAMRGTTPKLSLGMIAVLVGAALIVIQILISGSIGPGQ